MSFKPVVQVTSVPRDSSYFLLKDATEDYEVTLNPGGWGAPGGPADNTVITFSKIITQWLGANAVQVPSTSLTGDLFGSTGQKVTGALNEGVTVIQALYGMPAAFTFTAASDVLTTNLTGSNFDLMFGGVSYLIDSATAEVLYKIKSTDSTAGTITLYSAWAGGTVNILKAYAATIRILVTNVGEGNFIKEVHNLSVAQDKCNPSTELMSRLLLSLAAKGSFSCGNYLKAHNAALLLSNKPSNFKPCTNC